MPDTDKISEAATGPMLLPIISKVNGPIATIKITNGKARIRLMTLSRILFRVGLKNSMWLPVANIPIPNKVPKNTDTGTEIPSITKVSQVALRISLCILHKLSMAFAQVSSPMLILPYQFTADFGLGVDLIVVHFHHFQQFTVVQQSRTVAQAADHAHLVGHDYDGHIEFFINVFQAG